MRSLQPFDDVRKPNLLVGVRGLVRDTDTYGSYREGPR